MEKVEVYMSNEKKSTPTVGVVVGCKRLNIREEPGKESEVVDIVPVETELLIDSDFEHELFYSVLTPDGIDGYCMKEFVDIN